MESTYWTRYNRLSRRRLLGTGTALGVGAAGLALTGCGSDDDDDDNGGPTSGSPTNTAQPQPTEPSGTPKAGGEITVRVPVDPPNFSPLAASGYAAIYGAPAYSMLLLTRYAADRDISNVVLEGDLAESLPEQPDDLTMVFTIRPNVHFQDVAPVSGRALTVQDIKASIDALRLDDRSGLKSTFSAIDRVETPDDSTVRVVLSRPDVALISQAATRWGWLIFPEEQLEGDALLQNPIGTGPYILDTYEQGNRAVYRKNPNYFKDGLPYLDKVTYQIIPEDASAYAAFIAGQVNVISDVECTNSEQIQAQRSNIGFQGAISSLPGGYIAMDLTSPPFNDPRVRKAVAMAFNRQAEIQAVMCGEGFPAQLVDPLITAGTKSIQDLGESSKYWDVNIAEAKALLDAAAIDQLEAPLYYTPAYGQAYITAAERALQDFNAAGFNITPTSVQYADWLQGYFRPPVTFKGLLWGPGQTYTDPDPVLTSFLHPDGRANQSRVNDDAMTALVDKQRGQLNPEERLETIREIQQKVADEQLYIGRTLSRANTFWDDWIQGWGAVYIGYPHASIEYAWDSRL